MRKRQLAHLTETFRALGPRYACWYIFQRLRERYTQLQHPYVLRCAGQQPLYCRPNTSDIAVFKQVFIQREYAGLDDTPNISLVVDCGANVGYSSAYFLNYFPTCHLIAIEPDPSNFAMLQKNLAAYKQRSALMPSAIWSHPTGLVIEENRYRDGRAWSRQVRECRGDEQPAFQAVDIDSVLNKSGQQHISILKMDIEGAEAVVFSANVENWIDRVDTMIIELHDDSQFGKASEHFYAACGDRFQITQRGGVTVCKRINP